MIDCLPLHCFRGRPDSNTAIQLLLGLKSQAQQEREAKLMLPHQHLMLVDLPRALRTAAGVAGGVVVGNMLMNAFSHHGQDATAAAAIKTGSSA